jgi:hypothetical protein
LGRYDVAVPPDIAERGKFGVLGKQPILYRAEGVGMGTPKQRKIQGNTPARIDGVAGINIETG